MRKALSKIMTFVLTFVILVVIIPSKINTVAISADQVKSQLDYYVSSVYKPGSTPPSGSYRSGTSGCFGFVDLLLRNIMGHNLPSYKNNHYEYQSNSYLTKIGNTLTVASGTMTAQNLKNLFLQAQPGDIVQMDYTVYSDSSDSLHTMIVYSVSDTGVVFYHAGKSKVYFGASSGSQPLWGTAGAVLSWNKFLGFLKSSDDGISLYRSNSVTSAYNNPKGCVDNIIGETGSVFVSGWAFDADNLPEALYLLVYIEGEYAGTVLANTPRTDVDDVYHVGAFHGFEASITTDKTGYHEVAVYALNLGGGDGVVIGYKTVYIAPRHTHSYGDWQVVTHATCTTSGSSKRVCSCGDVETRIDAATGHSWNSGEIIANAGCTAGGLKKYTCSMCDATITEVISAFGHTPVIDNAIAATCTEDGITEGSHCAVCDAIIKPQQTVTALGHDDKIISVKKSCDFVVATYKCTRCGETYDGDKKESIEFDWSESKPQGIDDSLIEKKTQYSYRDKATKTSDNSSLSGWTLDYSTWVWSDYGAWSGWSDGPYYASDSRQIDTQTVVASYNYKTVWHYYCYSSNANLTGGTSYYPTSKYGYNKYSFDFEEELSPTGKTYTYNGYTMVQYKWWYSNTNYHHVYAVYPGEAPYQYTTQEIASTNYKTQYRYRDRNQIYTYYYYKWSDFSDWSDTEYIANENRQVKTRILYKFSIIPIGHLYSTSWGFDEQSHWHKCENCGVLSNLSHHAGGTASCNQKAICEICGVEYGDYNTHAHKFGNEGICENCGIHLGDANADGKIDAKDLALIITAILTDADYDEILDTNGNEKIDLLDIVKLKKYLVDNSVTLGKS